MSDSVKVCHYGFNHKASKLYPTHKDVGDIYVFNRSKVMKRMKFIWALLLVLSFNTHAQLQLVDLRDLRPGKENHQAGKIPVFRSALLNQSNESLPKVTSERIYNIYNQANLMAAIDGQLVVFPKQMLAVSNGFSPFKDLMGISNGYLKLKIGYGVAQWTQPSISNGYFYFQGFASLRGMHAMQESSTTLTLNEIELDQPSTTVITDDPDGDGDSDCWSGGGSCDDREYDIRLDWFLNDLNRQLNPWDRIMVMVDGVMVEMSVGALGAHLRNGAFRLGNGDRWMPEFP